MNQSLNTSFFFKLMQSATLVSYAGAIKNNLKQPALEEFGDKPSIGDTDAEDRLLCRM